MPRRGVFARAPRPPRKCSFSLVHGDAVNIRHVSAPAATRPGAGQVMPPCDARAAARGDPAVSRVSISADHCAYRALGDILPLSPALAGTVPRTAALLPSLTQWWTQGAPPALRSWLSTVPGADSLCSTGCHNYHAPRFALARLRQAPEPSAKAGRLAPPALAPFALASAQPIPPGMQAQAD